MPRVVRRLLVLETLIAYPALIVGYRLLVGGGAVEISAWTLLAVVPIVIVELGGLVALATYVGHRADPRHGSLDERQRTLAMRAQAVGYSVLATVVAAVVLSLAAWIALVGPIDLDTAIALPLAIMVVVYLPVIPSAVLAWIDPDAPVDDDTAGNP